jgi:hypothetical protein
MKLKINSILYQLLEIFYWFYSLKIRILQLDGLKNCKNIFLLCYECIDFKSTKISKSAKHWKTQGHYRAVANMN